MAKSETKAQVYWVSQPRDGRPKINSAPAGAARAPALVFPDERSAWLDADSGLAWRIRSIEAELQRLFSERAFVQLHLKETDDE